MTQRSKDATEKYQEPDLTMNQFGHKTPIQMSATDERPGFSFDQGKDPIKR
jgi:hypothetical protein